MLFCKFGSLPVSLPRGKISCLASNVAPILLMPLPASSNTSPVSACKCLTCVGHYALRLGFRNCLQPEGGHCLAKHVHANKATQLPSGVSQVTKQIDAEWRTASPAALRASTSRCRKDVRIVAMELHPRAYDNKLNRYSAWQHTIAYWQFIQPARCRLAALLSKC